MTFKKIFVYNEKEPVHYVKIFIALIFMIFELF